MPSRLSLSLLLFLLQSAAILASLAPSARGARSWLQDDLKKKTDGDHAAGEPSPFSWRWKRQLRSEEGEEEEGEETCDNANCSKICGATPAGYNDTCHYVMKECVDKFELFNYLRFAYCNTGKIGGFIILALWLFYLLLLLSTTVDKFFVPVLQLLADKLRLPSSIAGMTLLALGNGAPDIFVAFSALQDDDLPLMLGALLGAGLFIVSVVLGTVLFVSPTKSSTYNINPLDFMRDILAYIVVLAIIVGVAHDQKVTVAEAICFPLLYVLYVALVVSLSYFMEWLARRKREKSITNTVYFDKKEDKATVSGEEDEDESDVSSPASPEIPRAKRSLTKDSEKSLQPESEKDEKVNSVILPLVTKQEKLELVGLTIPKGKFKKVIYVLEFPFSFLRWLTIPPCCHDGQWSIYHFLFAVFSPVPMSLLLLLVGTGGWSGFTRLIGAGFPLAVLVPLCASPLCVVLFLVLSYKKPPHWVVQIFLMIGAFVMSIAWLNLIANEVVSVLQALGLLVGISTAILGLTVLAIGNSVADWVADSLVSYKGKPEMAIASCFGAPLITHVLGLSVALLPKVFEKDQTPYSFDISDPSFVHVKMSWIFLGIALVGSAIVFPIFKFKPYMYVGTINS